MWPVLERKTFFILCILVLACRIDSSNGLPVEQPTKFTLSTGDANTKNIAAVSGFDEGRALASESQNNVASVIATESQTLDQGQSFPQTTQYPPVTNTRPNARENARLENESAQSIFERPASKPFMGVLESFLNPTPIVDGIKEQDKYGNSGDKFIGIGRALVNGFEGFSNFLNAIVDFPRNAARKTSRGITEALNNVGARLVGLQ